MSKMIQLRNVPDPLHRELKSRAALKGLSLSDYLLKEIELIAQRPTMEELKRRIESRAPVHFKEDSAEIIRAARGPI